MLRYIRRSFISANHGKEETMAKERRGRKAMFYIPFALDHRLTEMADALNVSRSELVVESIEERLRYLENIYREEAQHGPETPDK